MPDGCGGADPEGNVCVDRAAGEINGILAQLQAWSGKWQFGERSASHCKSARSPFGLRWGCCHFRGMDAAGKGCEVGLCQGVRTLKKRLSGSVAVQVYVIFGR